MDVRCERCSSLYDFDESRVPAEGLSVKCSSCGHVFRVSRPGAAAPAAVVAAADDWLLRQATSGKLVRFKDLAALQRWIIERRVRRDDELSNGGKDWRRLGDLPDLQPFFKAIEAQAPAVMPQVPAVAPAAPYGTGAFPVQGSGMFPAQGGYPVVGQGTGVFAAPPALTPAPAPPQAPPPGFAAPQAPAGASGARWEGSPQPLPQVTTGTWQIGSPPPPGSMALPQFAGGQAREVDLPARGGKAKWIVLALIMLLAAGAGGVWVLKPELVKSLFGPKVNQAAVAQVSAAYAELRKDSDAAIERARGAFEKAVSLDGEYAAAHAGLAQAELARAGALLEDVAGREAKAAATQPPDPAVSAELEQRKKEAQAHLDRGLAEAKRASELAPDGAEGLRVMADWNRLTRNVEAMKGLLEQARQKAPGDPWVAYVSGASVSADPSLSERAIRYFDEALETAPDLNIARYHLARVFWAQGNKQKAKELAEKVLAAAPDHERAKALMLELEPPPPPPPAAEPEATPAPEAPKQLDYDQLFAKGDRLRQAERPREALRVFEKAAELNATDPEVYNAMGLCYLDLEGWDAAIASFSRALTLVPRFSDAHFGIAQAYQGKGQKRDAVKHYRAYLDLVPEGEDAEVAKRALSELQQ
jgi:predicted Zn finger-like uncharacterized protein